MRLPLDSALDRNGASSCFDAFREARGLRGGGQPEHWARLLDELEALGPQERLRRFELAHRIVREQGITYNVYGDERGMERQWNLDPLPMLLSSQDWASIEKGLVQRATLLNAILADCYGPQRLIEAGVLPPALLFAQPEFLRAVHGIAPPSGIHLNLYAADIARAPDGNWWVLSDRTQIPTGAGYALANRLVTARVLPEAFREGQVQRLASFFARLRDTLARLGTRSTGEPRIVLLTPGPYNETYFEQAYLARYLGYSLVEGQDLAVHNRRVYLKTLSGLEPVDVILRRVDDAFCDPLELRNDSILGVPGLVDALRAGNVALANSLGSGIVQSAAFKGFLPGLCRHLLGEDLLLPSLATWWCGQDSARRTVLERLDTLSVRPAFSNGPGLPKSDAELREAIRFAPHRWLAQEPMRVSLAPSWERDGWVEKSVVLRVFLLGTPEGYVVMPGALARIGPERVFGEISMQDGAASKDTWVLSEDPVDEVSLLQGSLTPVELRRVGNNLPCRLADNFFWLGRYTERIDAAARVLRATLLRFNTESGAGLEHLLPLLRILAVQEQIPKESAAADRSIEALEGDFLEAIVGGAGAPGTPGSSAVSLRSGTLRQLAGRVVRLAMLVRDRTSNDLWRALSQLEEAVAEGMPNWSVGEAIALLNRVLLLSSALKGIVHENMTRAQGWRFLDMGQRVERAMALCTSLREMLLLGEAANPSQLEVVLELADSTLTYRSRYNLLPNLSAVYDLVLLDDTNPRSLLYQLLQLEKHSRRLPTSEAQALPSAAERLLIKLLGEVRLLDPRELGSPDLLPHGSQTARVVDTVLEVLPRFSEAISVTHFEHSRISRTGS